MGEQNKFRSEQSRKNFEKAERQRANAQKRKAFTAKKTELTGKVASWLSANKKKAALIAAAAVLVLVLVWLGCKWFVGPDGSVPYFFGTLVGKQGNWLVINTAPDGEEPRYYHLADFDIPAGYTRDDYSVFKDGIQQDFFCIANDESHVVQDVYISAAKNLSAAEYPHTLLSYGLHYEAGEPKQMTINGQECYTLYLISNEIEGAGEGMGIAHLSFYFDTGKNACLNATFRSATLPFEQLPDEATLMAEAEIILSGLTLIK